MNTIMPSSCVQHLATFSLPLSVFKKEKKNLHLYKKHFIYIHTHTHIHVHMCDF